MAPKGLSLSDYPNRYANWDNLHSLYQGVFLGEKRHKNTTYIGRAENVSNFYTLLQGVFFIKNGQYIRLYYGEHDSFHTFTPSLTLVIMKDNSQKK